MRFTVTLTPLLTILFAADASNLNRFFWQGNQPQRAEEVQMIEIVRWRQPVCVKPAKGVSSCLEGLRKSQLEYERATGKESKGEKGGYSIFTDVRSKSSVSSLEQEVASKFVSPEIVASFPLEPSRNSEEFFTEKSTELNQRISILTEEQERDVKQGKHLPHLGKVTKAKQIYITKVLSAPVTATLVAHNCLPDIGIPLCDEQEEDIEPSESTQDVKPSLSITLANPNEDETLDLPRITNKSSIESIDEIQGKKPEIVIKNPDFVPTSTSFTLDLNPSTTHTPPLQHIVILRDDKLVFPTVAHKPAVLDNISPSRVFENPSQKENSNQFAESEDRKSLKEGEVDETPKKQEISLDRVQGVDKFNLAEGKPVQQTTLLDWLRVTDKVKETQDAANPDEKVEVKIATREK